MDAFIYMVDRLPCGIDELEDALDSALGDRGEVRGSGTGRAGGNLDVFVKDGAMSAEEAFLLIRQVLANRGVPDTSWVVIDGIKHSFI